jgi:DNA-binding HxlR family transcriptional regulator
MFPDRRDSMNEKMSEGFQLIHDIFRKKWIPEIIEAIVSGHTSYTAIAESIDFISKTELNRKLEVLQKYEVIEKQIVEGRIAYNITPFGNDLDHIFNHFIEMSDKYISKISTKELV